jgi:predicted  nucleic acid-binding Zn-ribbon protein
MLRRAVAVKKEAERQHVDLTAKRLSQHIKEMKPQLEKATTAETAKSLLGELQKHKRKSPARETTLPEVRNNQRKLALSQAWAFLAPLKDDPEFRRETEAFIREIVAKFGLIAVLSQQKRAAA